MWLKISSKFLNNFNKTKNSLRNLSNFNSISNVLTKNKENDEIVVKGWIKALRKQKENVFIDVSDGSTNNHLQIFIPASEKPADLSTGSSIIARGVLKKTPKGQIELNANKLEIQGNCVVSDGYPFAPRKSYPPEYIRQYLHFRPRTKKFGSLLRIRDTATRAVNDHFYNEGYFNIHTPILTSNDCEGAGETFCVLPDNKTTLKDMMKKGKTAEEAYFNNKAFLTVSGQLQLEAVVHGLSKVYTFGPTFRAENSKSRLHLSEFYMIEAETAFITELEDVMKTIEMLIKNVTNTILNKHQDELENLNETENSINHEWLNKPFVVLKYDEALEILKNNSSNLTTIVDKNEGLTKEQEIFLVKYCGNVLTFLIDWPKELKSFYMKECSYDSSKVAALDLLAPNVGEIVGGSLRENNYDLLKNKLPPGKTDLDWYLELRKFGSVPTGGFGMGFERYLQFILGISNIKDTIPFPRWPHNCSM